MRTFPSSAIDIVRINFTFESGYYYQPMPLVSSAAFKLFCMASHNHTSQQVAEFLDYRGIVVEKSYDTYTNDLTVYVLRKYAEETLRLLHELFADPCFSAEDYDVVVKKLRQTVTIQNFTPDTVVRRAFNQHLLGMHHPMTHYAVVEDVDNLSPDTIILFIRQHLGIGKAHITMAGACDEALQQLVDSLFHHLEWQANPRQSCVEPRSLDTHAPALTHSVVVPAPANTDLSQTPLYVGKMLQLFHDDHDFYYFAVLNTLLGGYFGSRLMSNIREDKGYTYSISSVSMRQRGINLFRIASNVRYDAIDDTLTQIRLELQRLIDEPVSWEELKEVQAYMRGELIRSRDGVFELSEIHIQQSSVGILTDNYSKYLEAIDTATPQILQSVAVRYLQPDSMYWFTCGETAGE